ncbi:polymeric immunoglobulin receptor-like [Salminus brasiliensis]|uniref:polymeric immunoglobulin receptor-like n=1 Tax=Salminus brasiliensis TaxID=930266 RepID=UPI003B82D704
MKALLIFTLHLISDQVFCVDLIGYSGGSVNLYCKHHQYGIKEKYFLFENRAKYFYKQSTGAVIVKTETKNQTGRFSISDDIKSKVVSVKISDVRKEDGGVYYCGVWFAVEPVSYFSFYSEIQLQITAPGSSTFMSVITPVSTCVALLLIGGLAVIFYRLSFKKTQVIYRQLSLEDAGLYQCGESGVWNHTVNLTVATDPGYLGPKTVTGYLGETITISSSYPEEFKVYSKLFYKKYGQYFTAMVSTSETQKARFSISEDRRSKVVSVNISDVRQDDEGVFFWGMVKGGNSVEYFSLYSKIWLHTTNRDTLPAPTATTPEKQQFRSSFITVSVCVVLLLVGGLILILYKLRSNKIEGSTVSLIEKDVDNSYATSHCACDYEEIENVRSISDTGATPSFAVQAPSIPSNHPNTAHVTTQIPINLFDQSNTVHATAQLPIIPSDRSGPLCVTLHLAITPHVAD